MLSGADCVDALFGMSRAVARWLTGLAGAVEPPLSDAWPDALDELAALEDAVPEVLAIPTAGVAEPVLVIDPVTLLVGAFATAG